MDIGQVVSLILGVLGVGGAVVGSWLASQGKKEDQKLAARQQAFDQLREVAEIRAAEIVRLAAALVSARSDFEARLDRQMARCRKMTDAMVQLVSELRQHTVTDQDAERALRALEDHREYDHEGGPADQG